MLYPYHSSFAKVPFFAYGRAGVQLFFLISGFVILMTLDASPNFRDFIFRRWLRLFPAMLVCSLLVFFTAPLFFERPEGIPHIENLIPGLLFVNPKWVHLHPIEGAFWSLFVEVKFYFIFGAAYFFFGWKKAVALIVFMFALETVTQLIGVRFHIGAHYFGWFGAGALFYHWYRSGDSWAFTAAILIGLSAALLNGSNNGLRLAFVLVCILFTAAVRFNRVQSVLNTRVLVFLGFISYPLYLLHENMMVAMIVKIGSVAPWMPYILMPVFPIAIVILFGWAIARFPEPIVSKALRRAYLSLTKSETENIKS